MSFQIHDGVSMKTIVISFGRMSPMTNGHQKLVDKIIDVAKKNKATPKLYLSHSFDKLKNPLTYDQKIKYAKKAFGSVVQQSKARTIIEVLKELNGKYDKVIVVVGGDRTSEFEKLLTKYNGKDYTFDSIEIVSAGERDPDATDVTGMSASKLRSYAAQNDFDNFRKGMPRKLSASDAKNLFDDIRAGMDINEVLNFSQRMKKRIIMRRLKNKIKRGRKIAQRKMANTQKLQGRAKRQARQIMRGKLAGSLGKNYAKLPISAKIQIDKKLEKRKQVIDRLAKRILPKTRKAERERLASFRSKMGKRESLDQYIAMNIIMEDIALQKLSKKLLSYKDDKNVMKIVDLLKKNKLPDKNLLNKISKKYVDDVAMDFATALGPDKTSNLYN